jgi:hypothetical protein
MKTSNLKKAALVALASTVFAVAPASAQNLTYDQLNPDLILFFQQFGGTQTVMVNLGIARAYRDATANIMNIVNIGGTLSGTVGSGGAGYGATWYDDTRLASDGTTVLPLTYWGIAAVRSSTDSNGAAVNGDGHRTIYTSQSHLNSVPDGTAGSSMATIGTNGVMTSGSSAIIQMTNRMETTATGLIFVEAATASNVDNQNPFLGDNLGTAFGTLGPGGVMGGFGNTSYGTIGGVAAEGALDLYRILGSSTAAGTVENGGLRVPQYQGTFVIEQDGDVSYIAPVPEPSTFALLAGSAIFGLICRRRSQRD